MQPTSNDDGVQSTWLRGVAALRPVLMIAVVLAVVALAWFAARRLTGEVSYQDLMAALSQMPWWAILAAIALTGISFAALTVYDFQALDFVERTVPRGMVALASFSAYAVGNTAGFGPLTAGAVRYRFYSPYGVEPDVIARIVVFASAAFGIGLTGVIGLGFLVAGDDFDSLSIAPVGLQILGGVITAALIGLWLGAGKGRSVTLFGYQVALPGRGLLIRQFLATSVDVAASAAVLWVLLPPGAIGLPTFIIIYSVAIGLGVLSHVPAGLGVFETVIIAALGPRVDVDQVLGALVLYRVIYHLVPLALAALILSALEVRRAAAAPMMAAALRGSTRLAPAVLGALAFAIAAIEIFSGVTPLSERSVAWLTDRVPLSLVEAATFFDSILSVLLLVVARGLVYRLDGAWWAALIIVPLSIVLSLVKSVALVEVALLSLLFVALLLSRRHFSRHASLLHQALTPNWVLAVATLLITAFALLFYAYQDVEYANDLWWQFEFDQNASRSLRAMLGVMMTATVVAALSLLRPVRERLAPPSEEDIKKALEIGRQQPRIESAFVAMGDKSVLFSEDGKAFIMYGRQGRSWVALSDPIGPREAWPSLIWRFVEMARAVGGRAVFYQAGPDALSLYADAGLSAFKLGEEARVYLPEFTLQGSKRANLRNCMNRSTRDGLTFTILSTAEIPAHLDELRAVSDAWMTYHNVREKRFSLGAFDPDYLYQTPIGILCQEGRIVAFASLLLTDHKVEASVDLMRFLPGSVHGVMETLLVHVILHFQSQGYEWFRMGMAPLSGLSDSAAAPIWHRVGRMVFDHGEWFYNFSGLRTFKAKFYPQWQPRYLVVSGGISPMLALADITVLISGGLKGVIGK